MSIQVNKPVNNNTIFVSAADGNIQFNFDVSGAMIEREGDSLIFNFAEGSVVVSSFFENSESLPNFTFMDGMSVSGLDLLTSFDAHELMTAAGPSLQSQGSSFFAADAGALFGGVDRLEASANSTANTLEPATGTDTSTLQQETTANPSQMLAESTYTPLPGVSSSEIDVPAPDVQGATSLTTNTDMNALFIIQGNMFGNYDASLEKLESLLSNFCTGLQGQNIGEVSFGAILFRGSNDSVRQLGPISLNPDDPASVEAALNTMQEQTQEWAGTSVSGANYDAAFEAATAYTETNAELWSNPNVENKVFFVANGQPTASNYAEDYEGAKFGWLNKGNSYDATAYTKNSGSLSSEQQHLMTLNGEKTVLTHNDFQRAVDIFESFVESVNNLGGSEVEVHAIGYSGNSYGNNTFGTNIVTYNMDILSFFDNTGTLTTVTDAWSGKSSSSSYKMFLNEGETANQGEAGVVTDFGLIAGQVIAAAKGEEFVAQQITESGVIEGDGNNIAYLKGSLDVEFGAGDDVVYVGLSKSTIDLGDGDNYLYTAYYSGNTITSGDGNDVIISNNNGDKIHTGGGDDVVITTGYGNTTIDTGAGNDLINVFTNGNKITTGEGEDTVAMNFNIKTSSNGEEVIINGTNTITDFELGVDTLDVSGMLDTIRNVTGNSTLTLENLLNDYAKIEMEGDDLRITIYGGDEDGYRRGTGKNGEDYSFDYSLEETAASTVVLQNFGADNIDLNSEAATLQTMLTIMNG